MQRKEESERGQRRTCVCVRMCVCVRVEAFRVSRMPKRASERERERDESREDVTSSTPFLSATCTPAQQRQCAKATRDKHVMLFLIAREA